MHMPGRWSCRVLRIRASTDRLLAWISMQGLSQEQRLNLTQGCRATPSTVAWTSMLKIECKRNTVRFKSAYVDLPGVLLPEKWEVALRWVFDSSASTSAQQSQWYLQ